MFNNKSFENGHYHPTIDEIKDGWHYPVLDLENGTPIMELQLPIAWGFRWAGRSVKNPISGDKWNKFVRPEIRVLSEHELPEHERELFIKHGTHTLKVFKNYGTWYGAFYQQLTLSKGIYQAHLNIYNDAVIDYTNGKKNPSTDFNACRVRLVVNGTPSEWRSLFPQHMEGEDILFSADGGATLVEIEIMMPFALQNSGIFADLWDIAEIIPAEEPAFGLPREQYERTYVLLPTGYDIHWARAVVDGSWHEKWTIGASADDAGIGQLYDKRVIVINPQEWENSIKEFFTVYYPYTEYLSITASTPEDLTKKLKNEDFDTEPQPNGGYEGPIYSKNTRGHWGLHVQILRDGVWEYLQNTTPGVMKYFGLTDVEISINANPTVPVVYRHFVDKQDIPDGDANIRQAAINYIAKFKDDAHKKAAALAANHDFRPLFWIESFNEMYPSQNAAVVRRVAKFDQFFAEEMYKEFGKYIGAALFCAAVGNPHESEYNELLRVAQAAVTYDGLLGIHGYWWANTEQNGLLSWWESHAGRWQAIDKYFKAFDLYPRWYSGEGGVVHSNDGYALNPGAGWLWPEVYNGNLDKIIADIIQVDILCDEWNKENGNRFLGNTFFTTGAHWTGWEYFQWQKSEMARLTQELINIYPDIPIIVYKDNNRIIRAKNRAYYNITKRGRKIKNIR